ncbi:MAG: phosphonate transporter substrate-binding protein [Verrucomicrobiota bacterium]|jgi:phosphonate transport system substrate-binding protein
MKTLLRSLLLALAGVSTVAAEEIGFGILGTDASSALKQNWNPFLEDMSKGTGLEIKGFFATDYAGLVEAMRFSKIQLAWLGAKAAIESVDRADGEVFAQFIDQAGRTGYTSVIITHRDSRLKTIEDMFAQAKELSFGMGDPQSTSGTLVPLCELFAPRGLDVRQAFRITRSSSHGGNLLAVVNKQVDVATNYSVGLEKFQISNPESHAQVRVLWTSKPIPSDPIVWRRDLPDATKKKIRDFVFSYGKDEREKAILSRLQQISGFRPSDNRQLIPVRLTSVTLEKFKVKSDPDLSPTDRAARLEALDRRQAELEAAAR